MSETVADIQTPSPSDSTGAHGAVSRIDGSVIEVRFAEGDLPEINSALEVQWDRPSKLLLEVQQHADPTHVRCVAIHETAGLACGMPVLATGSPITVPVGEQVLGRMINVVGETIDKGPDLLAAVAGPPSSIP